ncbi:MAG: DNA/RNA nuclease SfsA [Bacteroidales bacterium]|nr:DNA/RNA nuclease SfsA [Bacteroidales bacterium]MCF8455481.1 DNA/RNA nuclease SfsA [Bacteroidales bacterium]
MKFTKQLVHGKLIKRYKRFLVDVELDDHSLITAHTSNTGSMKSCIEEGAEVYLSEIDSPNRKTRHTWEMIKINGQWVGMNTSVPNILVYEALCNKSIPGLTQYSHIQREVTYGHSRLDLMATNDKETCYIEVKNVTLKEGQYARFPDAVSKRGTKHLESLIEIKKEGMRAIMLYIIQRMDVVVFSPAIEIDPVYAYKLAEAVAAGVEVFPVQVKVSPTEISLVRILSFELEGKRISEKRDL